MKDEWLIKCCNADPVELLKYLDVETYELVGESVMGALLTAGLVNLRDGESIQQYISSTVDRTEGWVSFIVFLLSYSSPQIYKIGQFIVLSGWMGELWIVAQH